MTIFADGSVLPPNPGGVGGWGFVVLEGAHWPHNIQPGLTPIHEACGHIEASTNNISELEAVIHALEWCKGQDVQRVIVVTDSQYVVGGITEWVHNWARYGWVSASSGERVSNVELWKRLYNLARSMHVDFRHIRGHRGHRFNEMADYLAGRAARLHRDGKIDTKKWPRPSFCPACDTKMKPTRSGHHCPACGTDVNKPFQEMAVNAARDMGATVVPDLHVVA